MSMSVGSAGGENEVMVEMNTTPLIDVMLVLLVMLIITIPIQTHAVKLDLPQKQENPPPRRRMLSLSILRSILTARRSGMARRSGAVRS